MLIATLKFLCFFNCVYTVFLKTLSFKMYLFNLFSCIIPRKVEADVKIRKLLPLKNPSFLSQFEFKLGVNTRAIFLKMHFDITDFTLCNNGAKFKFIIICK